MTGCLGFGCRTKRSPEDHQSVVREAPAKSVETASSAPVTQRPVDNPFVSKAPDSRPKLPYDSVAMALPQPVAEPSAAEDPSQYEPANPPWPQGLTEIYASQLVAKVKAAAQTSGTKGVLINTWASWCGPCKTEMPMLLEIRKQYAKRGIDVWFVSVDKSEQADRVSEVLRERGVPSPHYVVKGRLGYFKEGLSPIWKGSLPSTFLFDAEGRVRYYWGAHVYENELVPLLDDFLDGKLVDGVANFKVRRGPATP